jgi:hypothetical protein
VRIMTQPTHTQHSRLEPIAEKQPRATIKKWDKDGPAFDYHKGDGKLRKVTRTGRITVLGAALLAVLAFTGSASAHTLSRHGARVWAKHEALRYADLWNEDADINGPLEDYSIDICHRYSRHRIRCWWTLYGTLNSDGSAFYCEARTGVRFRSRYSRRVRVVTRGFDCDLGEP